MDIIKKLKQSLSGSLIKFAGEQQPSVPSSIESKTITHSGFRNVFNLYTEEFSGLTAYNIKHYFESARKGLNFFKASLFEEIKRKDMQIGGVCQSRKLGITGRFIGGLNRIEDFIAPGDKEMTDFIIENLSSIDLPVFFSDIVDASITGVSNFEIIYENINGKLHIKEVSKIPNELLVYDEENDRYLYLSPEDRDIFKLRTSINSFEDRLDLSRLSLIGLPEEKSLEVHALDGNAGNGLMNGCIDALIWAFFFKSYLVKDLATFLELFAIPAIIGKYDPLMSKEDRSKFDRAIRDFGNHFRMVVSKETHVDFITDTNKGSSSEIYHRTLEYWDRKIAIRVLGQNLSTEVSSGSYAAAQAHSIIREDFIISDMLLCETAVNTLIKKLVDLNYPGIPGANQYPRFQFPINVKANAEAVKPSKKNGEDPDVIINRLKDSRNGELKEFLNEIHDEFI